MSTDLTTDLFDGPPPRVTNAADYARIRAIFAQAEYTEEAIAKVLGLESVDHIAEQRLVGLLHRTSGASTLEALIRIFMLAKPVPLETARTALAPITPEELVGVGLLRIDDDMVRGRVRVRPFRHLLLACDYPIPGPSGLRSDFVMGTSISSLTLVNMTDRSARRATLDLGAGCGIQALLAAAHSERVAAVDVNPRAVALTQFNAGLNAMPHVESLAGNMFEPVEGQCFDLIVSNPPFIIAPPGRHVFLNPGTDSDEICRQLAGAAPHYLNEGGRCVFNVNWAIVDGEDWRERVARWFEGSGCDTLLVVVRRIQPVDYAIPFLEAGRDDETEQLSQWLRYFAERRIVAVGGGVISMQRRSGRSNSFGIEFVPATVASPAGDDLSRLADLRTFLHLHSDDTQLLETRLMLAPNVRLHAVSESVEGNWRSSDLRLRRVGGFEFEGAIDAPSARFLGRCRGQRPLREDLAELAQELGVDFAQWTPIGLAHVRQFVQRGYLIPAA